MRIIKNTFKTLFLLAALILVVLPYAAKYGAVHYLEAGKKIKANIDDVSINFFTGKIGLQGVHLYGEQIGEEKNELHLGLISVDLDVIELFNKNILIETFEFRDFEANISQNKNAWNIGGIIIPFAENDGIEAEQIPEASGAESITLDWGYGVRSVDFSNIDIQLSSQYTDSQFTLNKFQIKDLLSWHPANAASLILDLNINDQSFKINGDVTPFLSEPVFKTKVVIQDVQISPFLKSVKGLPFDEVSTSVFSDFDLELIMKNKQAQIVVNGSYGLKDLRLKNQDRYIRIDTLMWDGSQVVDLSVAEKKIINLDGLLSIEEVNILDFPEDIRIKQKKIELAGKYDIQIDKKSEIPAVKAVVSLMMDDLGVHSIDGKLKLLSFNHWAVKKIEVGGLDDINIQSTELSDLALLRDFNKIKTPALVNVGKLIVDNIHYGLNNIEISKVNFHDLAVDVNLNKQQEISVLSLLSSRQNDEEMIESDEIEIISEKVEKPEKKKLFGIVLEELKINPASYIHLVDNSVTPVYDTKIHDLKLSLKNIDTLNSSQYVDIDFDAKIDEYAKFELKGKVRPFSKKLNAKMNAKLSALELVPLSSYTGKFAGLNIKRGTLDFDANIKIKNNILDVKNTLYFRRLNVESDKTEISDNIFKDMPMPLDVTLNVLRDKNNVIKLDIPVKGDINNPDFSLQTIYNKAMVKAMKFAATYYLTQAVQPLGLIVTAGKLVGKAMKPKFDPLVFNVGSSEISRVNKSHIKKLAGILKEKDKLTFTICGAATESDWQVIQSRKKRSGESQSLDSRTKVLLKLANDRAKTVKNYFVTEYEISPKRLFICNGRIIKDSGEEPAFPFVDISL